MARPIVRAVNGITLSKRVILDSVALSDASAANFDTSTNINLLDCLEAQDEELSSNGTNIATCPLYSRVTSMRLNLIVRATTASMVRWVLHKRPDGETNAYTTSLVDSTFHGAADTQAMRELRKYTLAKGMFVISPDRQATNVRIFVRRKAWARASPMRENDRITLTLAKDTAGTTGTIDGFGTIWVRANA